MTDRDDEPQEWLQEGMAKHRELAKARAESEARAARIRRLRVANGFDRLIAKLLEGAP